MWQINKQQEVKIMFIMKDGGKFAVACAGLDDVKLLKRVGVVGIKRRENAKAILSRLVNSNYLPEGNY